MPWRSSASVAGLLLALLVVGCATVPITGRRQLSLIGEGEERSLGQKAYADVLSKEKLSTDAARLAVIGRTGRRIATLADGYLRQAGREPFQWEFKLIESAEMNAWCLPGGKVGVYTGLLAATENEAQLATVMSHEIGHAIARHGAERMSQSVLAGLGATAIGVAMDKKDAAVREEVLAIYGVGAEVGLMLPYSRSHEMEADHIGLMLMAETGYDPGEAVAFWENFAAKSKGGKPPEFLSTHPSDEHRMTQLRERMFTAQEKYFSAPQRYGKGDKL